MRLRSKRKKSVEIIAVLIHSYSLDVMISGLEVDAFVISFLDHGDQERKQDDFHVNLIDTLDECTEVLHKQCPVIRTLCSIFQLQFCFPI